MPKGKHIKWDVKWIENNFNPKLSWAQLAEMYDKTHGTETKPRTIEDKCHRLGITHWNCKDYTEQEVEFLKEWWPIKGSIWCSENIQKISGNKRSDMAIRNKAQDLGLKASAELWAKNIEANAALVRKPEGTIKMQKGSGVPYIKVGKDWIPLANTVYGKPAKGKMLCYLDGVVADLQDACHREAGAAVSVVLDGDVGMVSLYHARQLAKHGRLSDAGHVLQAYLGSTGFNELVGDG